MKLMLECEELLSSRNENGSEFSDAGLHSDNWNLFRKSSPEQWLLDVQLAPVLRSILPGSVVREFAQQHRQRQSTMLRISMNAGLVTRLMMVLN